jgi:putative membrane protein
MLMALLAHAGQALAPHDLWTAWNLHPVPVLALALAGWAYRRGTSRSGTQRSHSRRSMCFFGALGATAIALISPLDALSGALASAHMIQHVLLVLVAAPLLALSAPSAALMKGTPLALRRVVGPWQRRQRRLRKRLSALDRPTALWLLHVGTLWFWHASGPYEAALSTSPLHVLEHVAFVVTAFLFWRTVIGPRRERRVSEGFAVLLVFAMALQSVFLSALLTFASDPWYGAYSMTTRPWGLDPLTDQQLAGLIMWIPAGLIYLVAALSLLVGWLRSTEGDLQEPPRRVAALE